MTSTSPAPDPPILRRLSAFTDDPAGGNPAGVWIGAQLPSASEMLAIAAAVGFSETAFLAPAQKGGYRVRYFSPKREISFCGHATIAAGVLLGTLHGAGDYRFDTAVGVVPVHVSRSASRVRASLTSVRPEQRDVPNALLEAALHALGWTSDLLAPAIPPKLAWAGAWHLVLAVASRATLDALAYDYTALERLMRDAELTTLQLVWREDAHTFHARNPFPVGGIVEDPATGASAAALGGYLRDAGLLESPATFTVHQGVVMGRPSRIKVHVPAEGGVKVSGTAVVLDEGAQARVPEDERLAQRRNFHT